MTVRPPTLIPLVLCLFLPPAIAAPIAVTLSGQYPLGALGSAPPFVAQDFTLSFLTDTNPMVAASDATTFQVGVIATFASGVLVKTIDGTAGWFQDTPVLRGLDVRLYNFDGTGGWLQTIFESGWTNPGVDLFTGTTAAPAILIENLHSATRSLAAYYPTPDTHVFVDIQSADYSVTSIPEPGTMILIFLPLATILAVVSYTGRYGQSGYLR